MSYICNKCNKEFSTRPAHLSYGFKKGKPFSLVICPECRKTLSDEQVEEMEKNQSSSNFAEDLGILGY